MKRILCIIASALILAPAAFAQQQEEETLSAVQEAAKAIEESRRQQGTATQEQIPSNWTNSIQFNLGASQTGLFNWAAGGYNTASLLTALDARFDYKKDLMNWNNRIQLEFGFLYSSDKPWPFFQKTSDVIYIESKWAHKTSETSKFKYTASFDFRSQFCDGYEYKTPAVTDPTLEDWKAARILKSGAFSPAYTNLALGIEWIPAKWIDVNFAPLTGGFTIVADENLRKSYSMDLREDGTYRSHKFQFGAQLKTDVKFVINEKFRFETQLVLFTDYLHEPYLRVNWDNKIDWKISRLFKIGLYTWLISDPFVMNGDEKRGVQFKENIALSFTYTLRPEGHKPKKKKQ